MDRTLWDFDTNSKDALRTLHHQNDLRSIGIADVDDFIQVYQDINDTLWGYYKAGKLHKKLLRRRRFTQTLAHFGCDDKYLGQALDVAYVNLSPTLTALIPQALETLDYLSTKYTLHILTNGFESVQRIKLDRSGLQPYFKTVLTSERAKARKPDIRMFSLAYKLARAHPSESVMIGDDLLNDIVGARNANMDQVFFNPVSRIHRESATYEIHRLKDLVTIF